MVRESFRVIESKTINRGRTINLRVERVEVKGKEVIREVVEHHGASVIVPIREDWDSYVKRGLLEETEHKALDVERLVSVYLAPQS
jgi:ADP-ribose pyrophosphatase